VIAPEEDTVFVDDFFLALGLPADEVQATFHADPRTCRIQEKADRLQACWQRRLAHLLQRRRGIEAVRLHIAATERRLAHLTTRLRTLAVATSDAGAQALSTELIATHIRLERLHASLKRRESAYHESLSRLQQVRRLIWPGTY
jgi:hypothetical protein